MPDLFDQTVIGYMRTSLLCAMFSIVSYFSFAFPTLSHNRISPLMERSLISMMSSKISSYSVLF